MLPSVQKNSYWQHLAAAYKLLGSPLRPVPEDIGIFESAIGDWAVAHPVDHPRTLLLGATPAIALMRWPAGTTLIGADGSLPMMRSAWPGDCAATRFGICANWFRLPLPFSSVHIAIGDGSLNCVRHPEAANAVCLSLREVLTGNGLLLLRCYVRPERPERPEQIFDDMFRGAILTFSQFRFRLYLAMPQDLRSGVALDELYRLWASYSIEPARLAALTHWPLPEIQTIEGLRNSSTVHTFPTLAEFRSLLHEHFDEAGMITPCYPLGGHCPIFILRPRPGVRE
jgi:SAM-dependent methyltransferase